MNMSLDSCSLPEDGSDLLKLVERFNLDFPTEDHCLAAVFERLRDRGLQCRSCCSLLVMRLRGRKARCGDCGHVFSFTVGTFFGRVRKLKAWLCAISLLEQCGPISAGLLGKLVGLAASSAWEMLKKVNLVLVGSLAQENHCQLPSQSFVAVVCKRSLISPAGLHPIAEFGERADLVPAVETEAAAQSIQAEVNALVELIKRVFHGSSCKYLQLALSACWVQFDRLRWGRGALLNSCVGYRTISGAEIVEYVSPSLVILPSFQ